MLDASDNPLTAAAQRAADIATDIQSRTSTGEGEEGEELRMEWVRNTTANREFERFAADAPDPLLRAGFLMTGNATDAKDLGPRDAAAGGAAVEPAGLMDHPAAYAMVGVGPDRAGSGP
jgi:hypothetical protein